MEGSDVSTSYMYIHTYIEDKTSMDAKKLLAIVERHSSKRTIKSAFLHRGNGSRAALHNFMHYAIRVFVSAIVVFSSRTTCK